MILKNTFDASSTSSVSFKTMTGCLGYTLKSEGIKGLYRVINTHNIDLYYIAIVYRNLQYTTAYNI